MNGQIQSDSEVTLTLTPLPSPPSFSHADSLLHLPLDLVEEILFRLTVKSLLQLQCLCKPLKTMISDPKFHKKYLRFCVSSNRFQLYAISLLSHPSQFSITSYPTHSIFSSFESFTSVTSTNFEIPPFKQEKMFAFSIVGSCDGILCLADYFTDLIIICNPSIRKFKQLPLPLDQEEEKSRVPGYKAYGFGYDPLSHNYKVVVVIGDTQISGTKIHTLGTHIWRWIGDFPFGFPDRIGVSLSGSVNWLASYDIERGNPESYDIDRTNPDSPCVIVSLDLGNECFQQLPQPNYGRTIPADLLSLSVQRDCLCLLADHDIWMMKEFGNQSSWTKLITIPYLQYPSTSYSFNKLLCISEDDKMVLNAYNLQGEFLVYDSRNRLVKYHNRWITPHLSIESLISP